MSDDRLSKIALGLSILGLIAALVSLCFALAAPAKAYLRGSAIDMQGHAMTAAEWAKVRPWGAK